MLPNNNISLPLTVSACISGTFDCSTLLVFTNILGWFSLTYSTCRLVLICYWLLHNPYERDDEEQETNPPETQKTCLWEMAGTALIAYEVSLSLVLCIGTGSFVFEIKGFLVLVWCLNYPVFLMFHWVLGFFLTKCCTAQKRMRHTSLSNCLIFVINLFWRGVLYWCALNLLFHPAINQVHYEQVNFHQFNNSFEDLDGERGYENENPTHLVAEMQMHAGNSNYYHVTSEITVST